MTLHRIDDIDRELDSRAIELADMAAALIELDGHAGLEHLRRYAPVGATAARWGELEPVLGQLWADHTSVTSIMESAHSLRTSRLDDLTQLSRLCDELTDALDRMRACVPSLRGFFDTVDETNTTVAIGLGPSLQLLDAVGAPIPDAITDLLALSATDPLSLTTAEIQRRVSDVSELVALQLNWPDAVAAAAARLDALHDATQQAVQKRTHAGQMVVTGPLPAPADTALALRAELDTVTDPAALRDLQQRIESALHDVRHIEELAQGLLDRRNELEGRLKVYEAKAARLGLAEDPDVLSSSRIASGLLPRRPCDLRAVTRAITDYQQTLTRKREKTR